MLHIANKLLFSVPYMMYGHAMYGSPFMYPSVDPRTYVPQTTSGHNIPPFGLSSSNYQEVSYH